MFLLDLIVLAIAWGLHLASEKTFPKLQESFSTDWGTFLLFKPFHLILSFLCFMSALLLIRFITLKYGKFLFGKGRKGKANRVFGLTHLLLGLWLFSIILMKHPMPAAIIGGLILAYDVLEYITYVRKNRRLKAVLRELQE